MYFISRVLEERLPKAVDYRHVRFYHIHRRRAHAIRPLFRLARGYASILKVQHQRAGDGGLEDVEKCSLAPVHHA